jgi:hypothetical protein
MEIAESVEFEQSIEWIEKCTQEYARLQGRPVAAFFKRPLGIKMLRWLWFFVFSILLVAPLVGVIGTDIQLQRWFIIYFIVISMLLGALAATISAKPIELDILNSLLTPKGKVTYYILEAGLQAQHNGTTSITPWSIFSNIAMSPNFLLLTQTNNRFCFIPIAAFPSKSKLDEFAISMSQKISANSNS